MWAPSTTGDDATTLDTRKAVPFHRRYDDANRRSPNSTDRPSTPIRSD
jgi:hypothetical protein